MPKVVYTRKDRAVACKALQIRAAYAAAIKAAVSAGDRNSLALADPGWLDELCAPNIRAAELAKYAFGETPFWHNRTGAFIPWAEQYAEAASWIAGGWEP